MPAGPNAGCVVLRSADGTTPLADFGTVNFTGCQVALSSLLIPGGNPVLVPIGIDQLLAIKMVLTDSNGEIVQNFTDYPTPLGNDGQSFSVTWECCTPVSFGS